MSAPQLAVAMDWGGTWIRTALINKQGRILWQDRKPNPPNGTKEEYLGNAQDLLAETIRQAGGSVAGIGAAVAGPVEPTTGTFFQPPNLMVLDGVSFKDLWENAFNVPVWVGNDGNLAALGEHYFGAGKESADNGRPIKTLFYVTVSTGVGGGLVDKGSVFLGANGLTAEIGHTLVDTTDAALECQCRSKGCLESMASGSAIERIAKQKVASGLFANSALAALASHLIDSEAVFDAAVKNDPLAVSIVDGAVSALVVGLTNVVHLFNPDMIVLGGGVTQGLVKLDLLLRIRQEVTGRVMSELHKDFQLTSARLGDSVGLAGAAALVWDQLGS
ncbi:MAG: ROK family protein [Chloroflexota bacterium]|nr:ROK family protein [Dehalococcoidia bacterium]MEC8911122.1 ROK family protein [Chloroflexota bacterium]